MLLMQVAASGVAFVFGLVAFWYFLSMNIAKEIISVIFIGVNFAMLYIPAKNFAIRDNKSYTPLKPSKLKGAKMCIRDRYTVDALEKKGKVTDKKSEKDLGEIVDVQVENATLQSTTASGELKNPELPGRYTCYVTIRATGKESDDNYILEDSTELSVGRNVDLYSKYVKTSGDIKSVKVVE